MKARPRSATSASRSPVDRADGRGEVLGVRRRALRTASQVRVERPAHRRALRRSSSACLAIGGQRVGLVRCRRRPVDVLAANHPGELPRRLDEMVDEVGDRPVRARRRAAEVIGSDSSEKRVHLVETGVQDVEWCAIAHAVRPTRSARPPRHPRTGVAMAEGQDDPMPDEERAGVGSPISTSRCSRGRSHQARPGRLPGRRSRTGSSRSSPGAP